MNVYIIWIDVQEENRLTDAVIQRAWDYLYVQYMNNEKSISKIFVFSRY